eukprot:TRINITY_DN958_c0_g1_i1.p1 TRINITY_DN958_c0_g1~~TRINITY_DN958_c0_g1_i1.p1  ORF type:complete len:442 (+),score=62.04 TRINITY_DN958_c0_g1_i1:120-1445(+)
MAFTYRLFQAPQVLQKVLKNRGWKPATNTETCSFEWNRDKNPAARNTLPPLVANKFSGSPRITDKANMQYSLKRMKVKYNGAYDFFPRSFVYSDSTRPIIEKNIELLNQSLWICKPARNSCGRGIFLTDDLRTLWDDRRLSNTVQLTVPTAEQESQPLSTATPKTYIVQEYLKNPLLVNGFKFDLRVYVLMTSVHPLRIYLYREGLARFCTQEFSTTLRNDPVELYRHLCNTSVQKSAYRKLLQNHPGSDIEETLNLLGLEGSQPKIRLRSLFEIFDQKQIDYLGIWNEIKKVIIKTILPMSPLVPIQNDQNIRRFELFGFDFLLDSNFKPWIIEVNQSPSLSVGSIEDRRIKEPLLNDMLDVLFDTKEYLQPEQEKRLILDENSAYNAPYNVGNFELVFPFSPGTENLSFKTEDFDDILELLHSSPVHKIDSQRQREIPL